MIYNNNNKNKDESNKINVTYLVMHGTKYFTFNIFASSAYTSLKK